MDKWQICQMKAGASDSSVAPALPVAGADSGEAMARSAQKRLLLGVY